MEIPPGGTVVTPDHVLRGTEPVVAPPVDPTIDQIEAPVATDAAERPDGPDGVDTTDPTEPTAARGEQAQQPAAPFATLDEIFPADAPGPAGDTEQITVFTPESGDGALYVGDALVSTGPVAVVLTEALVRAGAQVIGSDDFLLGNPDAGPAESLDDVATYTGYLDRAETLRRQAQALLEEAAEVEVRIAEMTVT